MLDSKPGDHGQTGSLAPGKILALGAFLVGCAVAAIYLALVWRGEEPPYGLLTMIGGAMGCWMMALGFWWGMARESFGGFWGAVVNRLRGGS